MRRTRRVAIVLLLVAGIATSFYGAWIPMKAALAQLLLEHAWHLVKTGDADAKPWLWADTHPVARLRFVEEDMEMIVVDGANGRALAFGPGYMNGTSLPGEKGNSVIAGHRDTHFAVLKRVEPGDLIEIETRRGETVRYLVSSGTIVREDETEVLNQDGSRKLTLITCYPFDAVRPGGPLRYVVTAEAVEGRGSERMGRSGT